jgi:4,5-DOPA dioxygenase extradiol
MKRTNFIKTLALLPFAAQSMKLQALHKLSEALTETPKMPVLFLGHGSPMNAIEENSFVQGFRQAGKSFQKPKAILCISAHWETRGTFVTAMEHPRTIHDFGGFPRALHEVEYPAPGSPQLAKETQQLIQKTAVGLDEKWGLDHGAWSVIKHMYPDADVPVIQLSLDYTKPAQYHYELAQELCVLREKGVLIVGSGNMVHNLRMVAWDKMNVENYAYDWAREANEQMKRHIQSGDFAPLINFKAQGKAFDLAIPTPEHYLPLLYTLALKNDQDQTTLFNDQAVAGSLSMTSVKFG